MKRQSAAASLRGNHAKSRIGPCGEMEDAHSPEHLVQRAEKVSHCPLNAGPSQKEHSHKIKLPGLDSGPDTMSKLRRTLG